MIGWVLPWVALVVYYAIGWGIAVWDMQALFRRLRGKVHGAWSVDADQKLVWVYLTEKESRVRTEARWQSGLTMTIWPIRLPYLLIVHAVDNRDPVQIAQREKERDEYYAELERKYLDDK